jgi:hypothetical protein
MINHHYQLSKNHIYISSCNYILMNIHRVSNDIEWWYRWNQISIYGFRSLKKHQWQLPWSRIPRHFPAFSTGLGLRIFTDGLSNHLYIICNAYILLYIILYHIILYNYITLYRIYYMICCCIILYSILLYYIISNHIISYYIT